MEIVTANELQNSFKTEYTVVSNQCLKTIQGAHKLNKTWAIVEVPAFILGSPFYDQGRCLGSVCTMLKERKFSFKLIPEMRPPHVNIFVSWAILPEAKKRREKGGSSSGSSSAESSEKLETQPTKQKRVMFNNTVFTDLDITFNAMNNSGKLGHLKSFK